MTVKCIVVVFSRTVFTSRSLPKSLVRANQHPLDNRYGADGHHGIATRIHSYATGVQDTSSVQSKITYYYIIAA